MEDNHAAMSRLGPPSSGFMPVELQLSLLDAKTVLRRVGFPKCVLASDQLAATLPGFTNRMCALVLADWIHVNSSDRKQLV